MTSCNSLNSVLEELKAPMYNIKPDMIILMWREPMYTIQLQIILRIQKSNDIWDPFLRCKTTFFLCRKELKKRMDSMYY